MRRVSVQNVGLPKWSLRKISFPRATSAGFRSRSPRRSDVSAAGAVGSEFSVQAATPMAIVRPAAIVASDLIDAARPTSSVNER
jgi:hypothetical protein